MRELEREPPATTATPAARRAPGRLVILGAGRAGRSLGRAARAAGLEIELLDREGEPVVAVRAADAVLLCVPDEAIPEAAARVATFISPGTAVGHTSGVTTLAALAAAEQTGGQPFSIHPLQTIPSPETDLAGVPCAVAGRTARALERARALAEALGMRPFEVAEEVRAAYHAAASIASNFLVALEESAVALLEDAGVSDGRSVLAPLVLRTAANWSDAGGAALTGPIARGDEATVAAHLRALSERAPELVPLYEVLAERTRVLAGARTEPS